MVCRRLATRLYLPQDMTVGPDGRLYVVDWNNHRIRVIGADGVMHIVAGIGELGPSVDDPSTDRLNHPTNVAFDPMGPPDELWIAAWHNSRVKTATSSRTPWTSAEPASAASGATAARPRATLDLPVAVVFDADGSMLIADQANQMIRRVDQATAGSSDHRRHRALCRCGESHPLRAERRRSRPPRPDFIFPSASPLPRAGGSRSTRTATSTSPTPRISGCGASIPAGSSTPTPATAPGGSRATAVRPRAAQLGRLTDVAVGADGGVYIADTDNDCVRVVAPDGIISTFAGQCGAARFLGRHGPPAAALLNRPSGVEVGPAGDVYIADTHNHRIRVVHR